MGNSEGQTNSKDNRWVNLPIFFLFPTPALISQAEALKEENDSLKCQLDAYRNEVDLLKQEQGKVDRDEDISKDQKLKILQQALQGMQQEGLFPAKGNHLQWKFVIIALCQRRSLFPYMVPSRRFGFQLP